MSIEGKRADLLTPPVRGEIHAISVTTTTKYIDLEVDITDVLSAVLPRMWRDRFISIHPEGGDLYCYFSNNNSTAPDGTIVNDTLPQTASCALIKDGVKEHYWIPKSAHAKTRYLALRAKTGTITVRIATSSNKGT